MRASNPYPRELPTTQTTSPLAARCQRFSPRWSAMWAPHHHKPRAHRRQSREFRYTSFRSSRDSPRAGRQSEGISLHELLTRRRHAARGLRVAKNPITSPARGAAASTTARLRHERTASRHDTRGEHQARLQGTPNQNCKQRSGPPRTPNRLTAHAAAYHLAG